LHIWHSDTSQLPASFAGIWQVPPSQASVGPTVSWQSESRVHGPQTVCVPVPLLQANEASNRPPVIPRAFIIRVASRVIIITPRSPECDSTRVHRIGRRRQRNLDTTGRVASVCTEAAKLNVHLKLDVNRSICGYRCQAILLPN
jgi:hypothetical protein